VSKEYAMSCDLDLAARYITFSTVFNALRGWNLKPWTLKETVDFMVVFILKGLGFPYKEDT
jgi:hypothetical protein